MVAGIWVEASPLNNREVYWVRYLDWAITCPLTIYIFTLIANISVVCVCVCICGGGASDTMISMVVLMGVLLRHCYL